MKRALLFLLLFTISYFATCQGLFPERTLKWNENLLLGKIYDEKGQIINTYNYLYFEGAQYFKSVTMLPYYHEIIPWNSRESVSLEITNAQYTELPIQMQNKLKCPDSIPNEIEIKSILAYQRKNPFLDISFIPLRKNPATGRIEQLTSFKLKVIAGQGISVLKKANLSRTYKASSLLSSGRWFKFKVKENGIYKLTYNDIAGMGFTNVSDVSVYGSGGRSLSETAGYDFIDDLEEISVKKMYGDDGVFNQGDYILLYLKGPNEWKYNQAQNRFSYAVHPYSSYSYYYITNSSLEKKEIKKVNSLIAAPTKNITTYNEHLFHGIDIDNLVHSGRQWFGETFDVQTIQDFTFNFPGLITSQPLSLGLCVAGISGTTSYFKVYTNGSLLNTLSIGPLGDFEKGNLASLFKTFNATTEQIKITLDYQKNGNPTALGRLDYIELSALCKLQINNNPFLFRDASSVGKGNISTFSVDKATNNTLIWDITDIHAIQEIASSISASTLQFTVSTDSLREFIALDQTANYPSPFISGSDVGVVQNQNLHGQGQYDMFIVSLPTDYMMRAAEDIASYHKTSDKLKVLIVTPEEIYNEFSAGSPDPSAIRNFVKMFYDRATNESELPRFLLMLGDGSYDNKNISGKSDPSNFLITYQSADLTLDDAVSYVSDDFYAILDDGETINSGFLDIGVGRIPANRPEDIDSIVSKIKSYNNPGTFGDWRNKICFIADDEEENSFFRDAELMSTGMKSRYPAMQIDKIYLDAYTKVSTSTGRTYPDVNKAINEKVSKGLLLFNYTGHGGEDGLTAERVVQKPDILSWSNRSKLAFFITATCEFSRYDDFEKLSAGEDVILNPKGGAIALLTSARLVYNDYNLNLDTNFLFNAFVNNNENHKYGIGEISAKAKNFLGAVSNTRKYALLGDPAILLANPSNNVLIVTDSINGKSIANYSDTLKALTKIRISGHVNDLSGRLVNNYNGTIFPAVFDKMQTLYTLGNDDDSQIAPFQIQNSILFKGKTNVKQGCFSFEFVVPKDISYKYGKGAINYYLQGANDDANGNYANIIIGGLSNKATTDTSGPAIKLYLNDRNFAFGGMTNETPKIFALLSDNYGINTVGNGIGHNLEAILDNDINKPIVLNDYYETDTASYKSGKIIYQFPEKLNEGKHTLKLRAWNVLNNSSQAYTEFIVTNSADFKLDHVLNYPNPFTTHTSFYFEHNRPGHSMDVLVQVFTISGKIVKAIESNIYSDGFRIGPIDWDGRDDYGDKIGRGVYIYRIKIKTDNGEIAEKYEKLVIL
jgi:hypothetical protein